MRKTSRVFVRFRALLAPFILLACAPPTEHVLQFESKHVLTQTTSEVESASSGRSTLWLSSSGVREEEGSGLTTLFWPNRQQLARVHHDRRTYALLDLPIELETLADRATRSRLTQFSRFVAARLELSTAPEPRTIGPWRSSGTLVKVVRASGGPPTEIELWRTTRLEIDVDLLRDFQHAVAALDTMRRAWLPRLIDLDGVTVEYREVQQRSMTTSTTTRRLVSVEQREAPAGHFEVPAGYERVPYDVGATFALAAPRPLPAQAPSGVE